MLLVANVAPILPVVLDAVEPLPRARRPRTLLSALLVGNLAALAFALGGGAVLSALGSGLDDLRVAGGLVLLVFSIYDLLFSREQRKETLNALGGASDEPGNDLVPLVPLGIPMMVGPATLATILLVSEAQGLATAVLALVLNGLVNALVLLGGTRLMDVLGRGTVRTIGKVFGLMLAALAVSMIRAGLGGGWAGS